MSPDGMHESARLTYSSEDGIAARKEIFRLLGTYDATPEETERSLGLFLRGSLLARFLAVAGVYQRIVGIPGDILDVGTWRGQMVRRGTLVDATIASAPSSSKNRTGMRPPTGTSPGGEPVVLRHECAHRGQRGLRPRPHGG